MDDLRASRTADARIFLLSEMSFKSLTLADEEKLKRISLRPILEDSVPLIDAPDERSADKLGSPEWFGIVRTRVVTSKAFNYLVQFFDTVWRPRSAI